MLFDGIQKLPFATFKIGIFNTLAALEGLFENLPGQQIAVLGFDQGAAAPGRGGLGGHIEHHARCIVDLDYQIPFQISGCSHKLKLLIGNKKRCHPTI
jgi:hypothetical protein